MVWSKYVKVRQLVAINKTKVLLLDLSALFTKALWVQGPLIQVSMNNHADVYTLMSLVL